MPNARISRVPPGSQDLLADDVKRRRHIQSAWFDLSGRHGYAEVIPPTLEYEEVFTLGAGPDLASQLVRFVDRDGRLVALRADFTSSIARMAATKLAAAELPLRLSYAGKVYRWATEGAGDRREIFQLGAELIGKGGTEGDVEILRLVIETLEALNVRNYQINVGEIRFLAPLLEGLDADAADAIRDAVDRKDRAALLSLCEAGSVGDEVAPILRKIPDLIGRSDVLEAAASLSVHDSAMAGIQRLREIDRSLTEDERRRIVYDLGEIRGLGYYTGMRFEVFVSGIGRSVGSGGRYDSLFGLYGMDRPAVGFALETDALADVLEAAGR